MRRADILARHLWQQNQAKKKVINTEGKKKENMSAEKRKRKRKKENMRSADVLT